MGVQRQYICIDLKSYYASAECAARGLDPLATNLVVADGSRSEKTICLAVSPSLKAYGIPGRARLFEVVERVREINAQRLQAAPGHVFVNRSWHDPALRRDPGLALDYIVATPRMARYMACSAQIYEIYLKYLAPQDILVYSVDEVFLDATAYLENRGVTARQFAQAIIRDVFRATGITATAGIGSNLYLSKVAMDIVAKHIPPDENGVRIAELDEISYRKTLWTHRPLTDFWRVGPGYRRKLEENGLFTMGDVALCSLGGAQDYYNEALLYRLFGVNAGLLIDHAWGWEPCTLEAVRGYVPERSSLSSGQVLSRPYAFSEARVIVREMAETLALDLMVKGLITDQIVVTVGYDVENLKSPGSRDAYRGTVVHDYYGRAVPAHAHGTMNLDVPCSSARAVAAAALSVFDRTVDPALLVRRVTIGAGHVAPELRQQTAGAAVQLDLFSDSGEQARAERERLRERQRQEAVLAIKQKHGKNAILTGTNFREGATMRERNRQIGGHKA